MSPDLPESACRTGYCDMGTQMGQLPAKSLAWADGQVQPQAARIASAFTTCSGEPVKLNLNFPDRRVTRTLMESSPLAIIRKRSCLLISLKLCC